MRPLLLVVLLVFQNQSNPKVETKYDKFSDTTSATLTDYIPSLSGIVDLGGGSIYVRPGGSREVVYFHIIGVSQGKALTREALVSIAFTSRSKDWIYLKQTNVLRVLLNDKDRLSLGEMTRTASDVQLGGVTEQVAVRVPFSVIEKLAVSEKVEMQLGQDEFELSKDLLKAIQNWLSLFPKVKPVTRPSKPFNFTPS